MKISQRFFRIVAYIVPAAFLATILISIQLSSCFCCLPIPIPGASDYITELPNGYRLTRQYAGSSLIYKPTEGGWWTPAEQVGPSQYGLVMAVTGDYIVGNLDTEEEASGVPPVGDKYFIINTSTDMIFKGLSFEQYEKKMREAGFKSLPKLIRPNKRTRFVH